MKELKEVVSNLKLNQEKFFGWFAVPETNEEEMNDEDSNEEENQ